MWDVVASSAAFIFMDSTETAVVSCPVPVACHSTVAALWMVKVALLRSDAAAI